jgi:hypothetical protein
MSRHRMPEWRRQQLLEREAAEEAAFQERLGALMGFDDTTDLQKPHVAALWHDGRTYCLTCRPHAGHMPLKVWEPADTPCAHCGARIDHAKGVTR